MLNTSSVFSCACDCFREHICRHCSSTVLSRCSCALWLCSGTYLQPLFKICFYQGLVVHCDCLENISVDIIHQLLYQDVAVYRDCVRQNIRRHYSSTALSRCRCILWLCSSTYLQTF